MELSYSELPNSVVSAANGIDYAYRDTGGHDGAVPLVLLQHFRGNLDSWDPALVDALARFRRVITFDNAGVGGSAGMTATRSSRWRGTRSPSSPRSGSAR
jgi:pimeloyl-ACP methyl ester carboxylesterase